VISSIKNLYRYNQTQATLWRVHLSLQNDLQTTILSKV